MQAAFRTSAALYRGFVGGIGSGKSWVGAYDLLRRAGARPGLTYMITAPTYKMLTDSTARSFLSIAREMQFLRHFHRSDMIAFVGAPGSRGSEILLRSTEDPDRLRGPNLSGVWMDEASGSKKESYEVLIGRLREGGKQGWLSSTFTPKGLSHWTYEIFGKGKPPLVELFHSRTRDNPFLPANFDEPLRQQYSGLLAQQELEGQFVNVEGAEWPAEYFPDSIWFDRWPEPVLRVLALDPSKGKGEGGDYSAFVLAALTKDGHIWIDADLDCDRPPPKIVADGIAIYDRWQPQAFAIEVNQFQELLAIEFARTARARSATSPMAIYGINNSINKEVRIRTLGPYLARRELHFKAGSKSAELLVQQMRDFPEGEHDDGPDALEMAIRMLRWLLGQRSGPGQPEVVKV